MSAKNTNTKNTKRQHPDEIWIGLISISDRASSGVYQDEGIPALESWFAKALNSPWHVESRLIPDEKELISKANVTSIRTPSHRLKFYYLDGVLCKADLRVGA